MNIGIDAEQAAAIFFENLGFRVIAHRFKTPYGEIDLIVSNDELIVFVEVKYRKHFSSSVESISPRQQARIRNAAEIFLSQHNDLCMNKDFRFDALIFDSNLNNEHIINCF